MAGTGTTTRYIPPLRANDIGRIEIAWTAAADGTVSYTVADGQVNGTILQAEFVPGSGGTQPTNGYGVTLADPNGYDVLRGQGASLSNTTVTRACPVVPAGDGNLAGGVPVTVADILTLAVSGAGNAKTGKVILYVR